MWVVGKLERVSRQWRIGGVPTSTGTATVRFEVLTSSGLRYLALDGSTLTATPTEHPMTYTAGVGWLKDITVPSTVDGYNVRAIATHSDSRFVPLSEEHYVTQTDVDAVSVGGGGGGSSDAPADVEFEGPTPV